MQSQTNRSQKVYWVPAGFVEVQGFNRKKRDIYTVKEFGKPINPNRDIKWKLNKTDHFYGILSKDFTPLKNPWYRFVTYRELPANTTLFFDGWAYGDEVTSISSKKPDERWFRLLDVPIHLKEQKSIMESFDMPFTGQRNLTQPFGCYLATWNRVNYNGFHPGEDWGGTGFDVLAVATGLVRRIYWLNPNNTSLGKYVVIEHSVIPPNSKRVFSHYSHITPETTLKKYQVVQQGCKIGKVYPGCDHLHWEMRLANDLERFIYGEGYARSKGYYKLRPNIYKDGYICPSRVVESGKINGKHVAAKCSECDPIPADQRDWGGGGR